MTEADGGDGSERIGLFGGSFDPFHLGHLAAAQDVLERLDLSRVLFMPSATPPHKETSELTPAGLRLRMVRSGVEDDPRFDVSDLELRREGPSYTIDTLRELRGESGGARYHLIMGADQWSAFGQWREPWEIARMASIVVMTREGEGAEALEPGFPGGEEPPRIEVPVIRFDLSSTLIRERVRAGRSIRYLVPESVRRIIEAAKLYV
ncbi:MAG: nicotinate (nicotinamide) nucleotide adenylyltransferase [Gemmatimonadales bacterium]|nr:MAG: nicotinate (nicotinamide) nucleotide adenylyltransferase [Gemmatimonadales bacterium]